MKRTVAVLTTFLFCVLAVSAQAPPRGQLLSIYEEQVKPGRVAEYERLSREFLDTLRQAGASGPSFDFSVMSTDDFRYIWVVPVANMAALDQMERDWEAVGKKVGEQRWGDLMRRAGEPVQHYAHFLVREAPDLSYMPEHVENAGPENTACRLDHFYMHPGSDAAVRKFGTAWRELLNRRKVRRGFRVYASTHGPELPVWTVMACGRDAQHIASLDQHQQQAIGEEGSKLLQQFWSLVRRVEQTRTRARPEFAYPKTPAGQSR